MRENQHVLRSCTPEYGPDAGTSHGPSRQHAKRSEHGIDYAGTRHRSRGVAGSNLSRSVLAAVFQDLSAHVEIAEQNAGRGEEGEW
jgi:hypothetical protein